MRHLTCAAVLVGLVVATGCKGESETKSEPSTETTETTEVAEAKPAPPPPPPPADAAPAEPEPSTPEEIELARKEAILEGDVEKAVKYCKLEKIESKGEQAILGCVLAACRTNDGEQARTWAKGLGKALLKEARKVCQAGGVPI